MEIKNVAIFGGNGTVGSLMSGLLAGFGKAKVYLISRDKKKLNEELFDKIYSSIKSDSISELLEICDYEDAKKILKNCDWIFESVSEDYKIKESVYKIINQYAKEDALITTGTSGLSVHRLAETFDEKRRAYFFGTHFFNPPYHMPLCELITTKYTDKQKVNDLREYLEKRILRAIVISEDKPAFIANRIGFKLLNDLILLADKYKEKGGIDYIDSLFTGYTGRSMTPIATIDFVGLDIHKAIVDNIYNQTDDEFRESFKLPDWFNEQIKQKRLGKKTKQGLYKKEDTELLTLDIIKNAYIPKHKYVYDEIQNINKLIASGDYVSAYKDLLDTTTEQKEIVVKVLVEYIVYAVYISNSTAEEIESCDDAMAMGFGWCPPLALKELIEQAGDFEELCTKYIGKPIMEKYDLYSLIENLPKSKYDYRKYIKAV